MLYSPAALGAIGPPWYKGSMHEHDWADLGPVRLETDEGDRQLRRYECQNEDCRAMVIATDPRYLQVGPCPAATSRMNGSFGA